MATDLGPALVGAGVGAFSSAITYLMARRELNRAEAREKAARELSLTLEFLPYRVRAAERLWTLNFRIQSGSRLSPAERDDYVAALMWLDEALRSTAVRILSRDGDGRPPDDQDLDALRRGLQALTNHMDRGD